MNCPICDSDSVQNYGRLKNYRGNMVYCKNCNSFFPSYFPSDRKIEYFYQGFKFSQADFKIFKSFREKLLQNKFKRKCRGVHSKIKKYHTSKKLLDFGGGCGYFSRGFQDNGYDVKMIDVDKAGLQFAKFMGVDAYEFGQISDKFDIIFTSHVIEHYKDLHLFFQVVDGFINKDGILIIACPNKDSKEFYKFEQTLRYKNLALNKDLKSLFKNPWWCFDPPRHFYGISEKTISILAEKHGYKVLEKFSELTTMCNFCHNDMYSIFSIENIKDPLKILYNIFINVISKIMSVFSRKMVGDNLVVILKKES